MDKVMFVPGYYSKEIMLPKNVLNKLPKNVLLFSSVQFQKKLSDIKRQLEDNGKSAILSKSRNFLYDGMISEDGQLIGCNIEDFSFKGIDFDAFLYIGDGLFHPKALLVNNYKDVYCYDPKTQRLSIIDKSLHDEIEKRKKGVLIKFLSSKNIGILVTSKIGQSNPKRAASLKKSIINRWPDKKVFMFYSDTIDMSELENFNFIDVYVNTACIRLGLDDLKRTQKPIINIDQVERLLSQE